MAIFIKSVNKSKIPHLENAFSSLKMFQPSILKPHLLGFYKHKFISSNLVDNSEAENSTWCPDINISNKYIFKNHITSVKCTLIPFSMIVMTSFQREFSILTNNSIISK